VSARYENKLRTTSSHVLDVPFARVTSQHGGGGGAEEVGSADHRRDVTVTGSV